MKNFKSNIFFIGLLSMLFINCKPKALEIDIPQEEKKIVIASMNPIDGIFLVFATYSYSALAGDTVGLENYNQFLVKDADVSISYNNEVKKLKMIAPGVYYGFDIPTFYDIEYKLEVQDPTTNSVINARSYFSKKVKFDTISISQSEKDTSVYEIDYSLVDKEPDKRNWYMLDFINLQGYLNILEDTSLITSISSIADFFKNDKLYLIDENRFDDNIIQEKIKVANGYFSKGDILIVTVSSISEGYYNYLEAEERAGNLISSFISEPVSYPTNVDGGYGYFSTNFITYKVIEVK